MSDKIELPENSRIVRPKYIEEFKNKKDLVRRLRNLVNVLRTDQTVEVESPEWPGLAAVSHCLVQKFVNHSDKEVRLYSCLACVEIFCLYAPEVPWNCDEILTIFRQITTQLANLAHTNADAPVFRHYSYMLDQLANVRIACLLVDLAQDHSNTGEDSDSDDHDDDLVDDNDTGQAASKTSRHRRLKAATNNNDRNEPLEVLVELIHTLLTSVRREHSAELLDLVRVLISGCLEEYHPNEGVAIPIPILDELLHALGQGPTQWILAPHAGAERSKKSKQLPQIQVPNPTYKVAARIILTLLNKLAAPLSDLLNGLLNADPYVIGLSTIQCPSEADDELSDTATGGKKKTADSNDNDAGPEVYTIIFELHRVAPTAFTTVIGNISANLASGVRQQRYQAVRLLGRLFATASTSQELDDRYGASVLREWLGRRNDVDEEIRLTMVQQGVLVLKAITGTSASASSSDSNNNNHTNSGGSDQVQHIAEALEQLVTLDQSYDVRAEAVRRICDWAYASHGGISVTGRLLQAVAARVRSKHKGERRDALTGLAHVYSKQWIEPQLKAVTEGGDDCEISVIVKTLHDVCHLEQHLPGKRNRKRSQHHHGVHDEWRDISEERYGWIPATALNCGCYSDQVDPEMRSRVFQVLDELLVGKKLTSTGQAIALTAVMDSLVEGGVHSLVTGTAPCTPAFRFLQQLLQQRSQLQRALGRYLDARGELSSLQRETAEADEVDARAMEMLESIAKMTAPVDAGSKTSIQEVLQAFHTARDKHIFRCLSTITSPDHSVEARTRALDELPKRTKSLGDGVAVWVKNLVKRCAMGSSLNSEVIHHCVLLAHECFRDDDVPACGALLATVKTAVDIFPVLGSSPETYNTLTELFSACREATGDIKKELQNMGIVTVLSSILSSTTAANPKNIMDDVPDTDEFKAQMLQLCTRDGTPEQARNAVKTLARLWNPSKELATGADKNFTQLLHTLTSASRLKISGERKDASKLISVLSALTSLSECAPLVVSSSSRGDKAVKFALERVLLGRDPTGDDSENDSDDTDSDSDHEDLNSARPSGSSAKTKHATPEAKGSLLEDENLSVACRRICAAIEYLVSHIRSIHLLHKRTNPSPKRKIALPQKEQVQRVFQLLIQMIEDQGYPPSSRDRKSCKSRQSRAALRQCAAVSLLRLCDPCLDLHKYFFTKHMWVSLGKAFLDEETATRDAVVAEYADLLKGQGAYASKQTRRLPSLRFLAFVALCCDGDREHDAANACAANLGKTTALIKSAAMQCVDNMRKYADIYRTRCSAISKEAQAKYETQIKFELMPEYAVPFMYHLLSHRRETPGDNSTTVTDAENSEGDDSSVVGLTDEGQQRILRKRLKLVFDPLVTSLGAGANNISFLLRMTDELSKYGPVDVSSSMLTRDTSPCTSAGSSGNSSAKSKLALSTGRDIVLQRKLRSICAAAREVILTFVKKDVNLTIYPGVIQIPRTIFHVAAKSKPISQDTHDSPAAHRSTKRSRSKDPSKTPSGRSHSNENTSAPGPGRHSDHSARSSDLKLGENQPASSQDTETSFDTTDSQKRTRSAQRTKFQGSKLPSKKSSLSSHDSEQSLKAHIASRRGQKYTAAENVNKSFDKAGGPQLTANTYFSSPGTVASIDSDLGSRRPGGKSTGSSNFRSSAKAMSKSPMLTDDTDAQAKSRNPPDSDKSPRHSSRVHFSPDVNFVAGGHSNTHGIDTSFSSSRLSLSPLAASASRKVDVSVGCRGQAQTPGSGSDAQTLGSTPPSGLKTATMMTATGPDSPFSTDSLLTSTQPSRKLAPQRNNLATVPSTALESSQSSASSDSIVASTQPSTNFAARKISSAVVAKQSKPKRGKQGAKPSSTQSSLSSATLNASQESGETNATASTSTSRRSKRQRAPVLQDQLEPESKMPPKKRVASAGGKNIVDRKAKTSDPLDFDFEMDTAGEENKPVGRNKLVASQGSKSTVASRAKTKAKPSAASKAKAKGSARSGRNRR